MSGLDDGYHDHVVEGKEEESSSSSPQISRPVGKQPRRSMDLEFHDLNLDDLEDDDSDHSRNDNGEQKLNRKSNGNQSSAAAATAGGADFLDDSSDDDTFGEASVDCEPDKQYLEELLDEEYHPERLNLLDSNIPPRKDRLNEDDEEDVFPRRNGLSSDRHNDSDSDSDYHRRRFDDENDYSSSESSFNKRLAGDSSSDASRTEYNVELSDHPDNEDQVGGGDNDNSDSENGGWTNGGNDDSGSNSSEGGQDTFKSSPTRISPRSRPNLKDKLESMGKSTKKSFRTVGNKSFFSQPFKGLARSLSGGRRKKKKALEQQDVS